MRAIAVATLSFGLADIPVRVYASVESKAKIKFNLLHGSCSSRLRQQYVCEKCETPVERDDMVKGYEFAKHRYVTFTADEIKVLEQVEEPINQRIVIAEFVNDSIYELGVQHVEGCYFVGADIGSEKTYATLVRAMEQTSQSAIARYTARGHTHLVMLTVNNNRLEMVQLRFADEVRSIDDIPLGDVEPDVQTVKLTKKLIAQFTRLKFRLEDYVDDQQRLLQEHIQQKIDGHEIAVAPTAARPEPFVDIVDALEASLKKPPRKSEAGR